MNKKRSSPQISWYAYALILSAVVLVGLFYISVKMLRDVSKQEKMSKKQPERQLHPKLQQDLKDKSNQQ